MDSRLRGNDIKGMGMTRGYKEWMTKWKVKNGKWKIKVEISPLRSK